MRYLPDELFTADSGEPFKVFDDPNDKSKFTEQTNSSFLLLVLRSFNPTQGKTLEMEGIRNLNKALETLDGESENGYFALEDAHWQVVKQVVNWWMPLMTGGFMRQAPVMADLLDNLPEELPKDDEKEAALEEATAVVQDAVSGEGSC